MFKNNCLVAALIVLVSVNGACAEMRIWTSADGTQQVTAELLNVKGSLVELKLENGSKLKIPFKNFSQGDQEVIRNSTTKPDSEPKSDAGNPKSEVINSTENSNSASDAEMSKKQSSGNVGSQQKFATLANDAIGQSSRQLAEKNGLAVLNGLPVIFLDHFTDLEGLDARERTRRYKLGEQALEKQQRGFGLFLDQVAIGLDESWVEEYLPTFIANHFPKDVAQSLIQAKYQTGGAIGIWKGNSEFERRAAKQKFEQFHRKDLKKLAINAPFRFCFVSKAKLSPYDFSRKGLVVAATNKGGEDKIAGFEWMEMIPFLPSAGYFNKKINSTVFPVFGTTFWPVSSEVVKTLPHKLRERPIGNNEVRRWAFVATVVTFRNELLLPVRETDIPSLFGKVESVSLYAEPTLQTHLHSFTLKHSPDPVLAGSQSDVETDSDVAPGTVVPFDEFAVAGLLVRHQQIPLQDDVWGEVWNHASKLDEEAYRRINKLIAEHYSDNKSISVIVNSNNRSAQQTHNLDIALKNVSEKETLIDRLMNPNRQIFFPPYTGRSGGRFWEVADDRLTEEQSIRLKSYLAEHTRNDHFRLTLKLSRNPKTDEPTIIGSPLHPKLVATLQQSNSNPEHFLPLDENLAFDERGELQPDGTRTGLFRTPGTQYQQYRFLLNFGVPLQVFAQQIPKEIVNEALSQKSGESRIAVFLDVNFKKTTLLNNAVTQSGTDRPCIVFNVNASQLSVAKANQPALHEIEFTKSALEKASEFKPSKPVPSQAAKDESNTEFTPQTLLPLVVKAVPELLENSELVDQLMVMRWRFENVRMFDVTPDGVHFFDKGDAQPPSRAKRREKMNEFKQWTKSWAKSISGQFALHFDNFTFEGLDKERPSPAILVGGRHGKWVGVNGPQLWHTIYDLKHLDSSSGNLTEKEAKQLLDYFSVAPPYVCLEQQFAIPNSKGETWKSNSTPTNRVPGLNSGKPVEPIFPVVHFDKEIWPPANAAIAQTNVKPKLEVVAEIVSVEMKEKLPAHHWLETYNRSSKNPFPEERIIDNGRYALINVTMKSARLINPATGETLLPLVLKDYRPIAPKPVNDE